MKKIGLWIILLVQSLLLLVGFNPYFSSFGDYLFQNKYDGYKNYLTFHAYVTQPQDGLVYTQMNYPFGDLILYTDNTPLLAIFTHYCVKLWPGLAQYDLQWYNGWCLTGILLTSVVLYYLFRRLRVSEGLCVFFALALPWLSPQFNRLFIGHFNLSFSFLIPLTLHWCLAYYQDTMARNGLPALKWLVYLVLLLVLSPFIHMYYLPLLVMIPLGIGGVWLLVQGWQTRRLSWGAIWLLVVSAGAAMVTFLAVRLLDDRRHGRLSHAEGYDWEHWKLNFSSMFTTPSFMKLKFPFAFAKDINYESYTYLGTGMLFLLALVLLVRLGMKRNLLGYLAHDLRRRNLQVFYVFFTCTAVIGLMIALGEEYYFFNYEYKFINIFNPFLYLHKLTRMVEQFRCLGRFAWVFFWWINISGVLLADYLYRTGKTVKLLRWLLLPALLLVAADTYSTIKRSNGERCDNDLTNPARLTAAADLLQGVTTSRYQAILPIPYYHIGAEDYSVAIDPEESFFKFNTQLSLVSGLPQMGSKMSRTQVVEAKALCSLFDPSIGELPYLKARMKPGQPVLVVYWKTFYDHIADYRMPDKEPGRNVVATGYKFVEGLTVVKETQEYTLYEWTP